MRRIMTLSSLIALALMLVSQGAMWSQTYEEGELTAWQAIAETYYVEGVDEDAMFADNPAYWAFRNPSAIQPGMNVPDFTLLDMEGVPHSLSDYIGEKFILVITGSWY